jgi:hypothetical protein
MSPPGTLLDVEIRVVTADETVLQNIEVSILDGQGAPEVTKSAIIFHARTIPFRLAISKAGYATQEVTVNTRLENGPTPRAVEPIVYIVDDPGSTLDFISFQGKAILTVPLGRMIVSPVVDLDKTPNSSPFKIPKDEWDKFYAELKKKRKTPKGVDINVDDLFVKSNQTLFTARNQYIPDDQGLEKARNNPDEPVHRKTVFYAPTEDLFLDDETASGWKLFRNTHSTISPDDQSCLTLAEWGLDPTRTIPPEKGTKTAHRYLVAIWRPRRVVASSGTRDVIVYFQPNTVNDPPEDNPRDSPPYRGNYPYSLQKERGTGALLYDQPWIEYVKVFLFQDHFLAYQLLAAKRDCILIFPIQPYGQWQSMALLPGVARLVAETILFEHRHPCSVDQAKTPNSWRYVSSPRPKLGSVAIAGYSAGIANVAGLVKEHNKLLLHSPKSPATRTQKDEDENMYMASPHSLMESWKEVWDLDGSSNGFGTIASWAVILGDWQKAVPERRVFSYHTSTTVTKSAKMEILASKICNCNQKGPVANIVRNGGKERPVNWAFYSDNPPEKIGAQEWKGPTGTVVWMRRDTVLSPPDVKDNWDPKKESLPYFWEPTKWGAHYRIMQVIFSHAAARSTLKKL